MGCDMVVALQQATAQGNALFGLNRHDTEPARHTLCRIAGGQHAPDEVLRFAGLVLPQVRRTCIVLGSQPRGVWGLTHGINENRVAAGTACWQSKFTAGDSGLLGTDLVRLTLERSQSARQALDILTDLVSRHGQRGSGRPGQTDSVFLLADPKEAFVVEAAGSHWAMLECQQVRAVSDVALIRQDWRRIAPGLAELAISRGWWSDDGSKLDVTGSLAATASSAWPLKRWGKATVALEQQNGHIDPYFLRSLLDEHFDSAGSTFPVEADNSIQLRLMTSFVAVLPADARTPSVAWCTYGPAGYPLHFPMLLAGELPPRFLEQDALEAPLFAKLQELLDMPEYTQIVKDMLDGLQTRFDQQLEEFLDQARSQTDAAQLPRLAGLFMHNHWEMLESEARRLPDLAAKTVAAS